MTTFLIRTLELANIDLSTTETRNFFDDDEEISSWAKDSVYKANQLEIMDGTGNNMFSPSTSATNEQALSVIRRLLANYADLKWYEEVDGNRIYVRIDDNLYNLQFENNVVLDLNSTDIEKMYVESFNDMELLINTAHTTKKNVEYASTNNPNIKGILKIDDFEHMDMIVENRYYGVDKLGEKMTISINSDYNENEFVSVIVTDVNNKMTGYDGFAEIKYYDENDTRNSMLTLPTDEIFNLLGIEYTIEYHKYWDIYILEFNEIIE